MLPNQYQRASCSRLHLRTRSGPAAAAMPATDGKRPIIRLALSSAVYIFPIYILVQNIFQFHFRDAWEI
jgi:hypothetical protein